MLLSMLFILSGNITAFATNESQDGEYLEEAGYLKSLGLFQGRADGFELNRTPTRAEGAVMLVRMLGKEEEAKKENDTIPFKDVPSWASFAVAYLYKQQLASGVSANQYGSSEMMTAPQYATMLLRALGYSDKAGDFQWNDAIDKILSLGMVTDAQAEALKKKPFLRDHVVLLSYQALLQTKKGSEQQLADFLIEEGVFSKEAAESAGVIVAPPARLHDPKGVRIIRTSYSSLDIIVRTKELEAPLNNVASIALKSFDKLDDYQNTVAQFGNHSFDFSAFLMDSELKTTDTDATKIYDHYPLIKGAWSRNDSDPQTLFSYALVFYDPYKRPIAYMYEELPEYKDVDPVREFQDILKNSSETVKVTEQQRITSGITIKIKGIDDGNGALKNDPITNLAKTVDPKALPAFLTTDRRYDTYYELLIRSASPTNLIENGVPNVLLTPSKPFSAVEAFGGQGSFKYIAVVIFDEDSNIVGFYETTTS